MVARVKTLASFGVWVGFDDVDCSDSLAIGIADRRPGYKDRTMMSSLELGLKALSDGRFQQAIAILEATTQLSPQEPEVWLALARAYAAALEPAKALAAYHLVLANEPPEALARQTQAEIARIEDRRKALIGEAMRAPCGECGALIPASRAAKPWCLCGWRAPSAPVLGRQIYLFDVFAYSARKGVSVFFRRQGDIFVVSKGQFGVPGLGARIHPLDPRLVLPVSHRLPVLVQDELEPLGRDSGNEGLFRVKALGATDAGRNLTWRQMVAHLSDGDGVDVSRRRLEGSLGTVLVGVGLLAPGDLVTVRERKAATESDGQALVRFRYASVEEILEGTLGTAFLHPQPGRDFGDRLGARLVAEGLISQKQLEHALFLQSQVRKPLGQLLVQAGYTSPEIVEAALRQQPPSSRHLPLSDAMAEQLIARKWLTRVQLRALLSETGPHEEHLVAALRERKLIPAEEIERIVRWRERKAALALRGKLRLGAVLVGQRIVSNEALGQALVAQVRDPRPLGQLLVESGALTPEQLVTALEEQAIRRNQLAWQDVGELGPGPSSAPGAPRRKTRLLVEPLAATRPLTGVAPDRSPGQGSGFLVEATRALGDETQGEIRHVDDTSTSRGDDPRTRDRLGEGPALRVPALRQLVPLVAVGSLAFFLLRGVGPFHGIVQAHGRLLSNVHFPKYRVLQDLADLFKRLLHAIGAKTNGGLTGSPPR